MIIDGAAGIIGFVSMVGGLGGTAYFVALIAPPVAIAATALTIVAGLHTWLTRRR